MVQSIKYANVPKYIKCYIMHYIFSLIISWMASDDPYLWKGFGLAALFVLQNVFMSIVNNVRCKVNCYACNRVKTSIFTSLYRKVRIKLFRPNYVYL